MIPAAAAGVTAADLKHSTDYVCRTVEVGVRRAADRRPTVGRLDQPEQRPQCRGLARAVWSHEAGDLTNFG